MKYHHLRLALAALFLLLIGQSSVAGQGLAPGNNILAGNAIAAGTAFTYQGGLSNAQGPVTSTCDFRFTLFDALNGGDALGSSSQEGLLVSNGLFAVTLDFGAGAFPGADRWIETAVRCPAGGGSYTTLSPRQKILPTPYAMLAAGANASPGDFTVNGQLWVERSASVGGPAATGAMTLRAPDLWIQADSSFGRGDGGRALSHAYNDTLDINHNGDFAGGVVVGSKARVEGNLDVQGWAALGNSANLTAVTLRAPDMYLSSDSSFGRGAGGRAIAHDYGDVLSINHQGDFDGGVKIWGETTIQGWKLQLNGIDFAMNGGGTRGDGGRALVHFDDDTLVVNMAGDFSGGVKVDSRATVNGPLNVNGDLTTEGTSLRLLGTDFVMSGGGDRGDGGRALVHEISDTLSINHMRDFGGGVTIGSSTRINGSLDVQGTAAFGAPGPNTAAITLRAPDVYLTADSSFGRGDGGRALIHGHNDTLGINSANDFGGVEIGGPAKVNGSFTVAGDLCINVGGERGDGGRALVHDQQDTLTMNYNGDFAGGVKINDLRTGKIVEENLMTPAQQADFSLLPFTQGDVLCWDGDLQKLARCASFASPLVVGVADDQGKPIVLGAEPVKVIGVVQPGDLLIASDVAGYATAWSRLKPGSPPTGVVIAKALQRFDGDKGTIKALIFLQ